MSVKKKCISSSRKFLELLLKVGSESLKRYNCVEGVRLSSNRFKLLCLVFPHFNVNDLLGFGFFRGLSQTHCIFVPTVPLRRLQKLVRENKEATQLMFASSIIPLKNTYDFLKVCTIFLLLQSG